MNAFLSTVEKLPKGHPLEVYYRESALIQTILVELTEANPVEEFSKIF